MAESPAKPVFYCDRCGKIAKMRCANCAMIPYCSEECRVVDLERHAPFCERPEIVPAEWHNTISESQDMPGSSSDGSQPGGSQSDSDIIVPDVSDNDATQPMACACGVEFQESPHVCMICGGKWGARREMPLMNKAYTMKNTAAVVLGQGGFGRVSRYEKENGWNVAVKLGSFRVQSGRPDRESLHELTARDIEHPNVTGICHASIMFDPFADPQHQNVGNRPNSLSLFMDVANGTLHHTIRSGLAEAPGRGYPLEPWLTELTAYQYFRGLAHLHSNMIVHNDIKPLNALVFGKLMITHTAPGKMAPGVVPLIKVSDLGLCMPLTSTEGGHTGGTPGYLSPESIGGSAHVSFPADVWSAGIVLYELATGDIGRLAPFDAANNLPDQMAQLTLAMRVGGSPSIASQQLHLLPAPLNTALYNARPDLQTMLARISPAHGPHIRDLISRMLITSSEQRITLFDALQHPYFTAAIRETVEKLIPARELEPVDVPAGGPTRPEHFLTNLMDSWSERWTRLPAVAHNVYANIQTTLAMQVGVHQPSGLPNESMMLSSPFPAGAAAPVVAPRWIDAVEMIVDTCRHNSQQPYIYTVMFTALSYLSRLPYDWNANDLGSAKRYGAACLSIAAKMRCDVTNPFDAYFPLVDGVNVVDVLGPVEIVVARNSLDGSLAVPSAYDWLSYLASKMGTAVTMTSLMLLFVFCADVTLAHACSPEVLACYALSASNAVDHTVARHRRKQNMTKVYTGANWPEIQRFIRASVTMPEMGLIAHYADRLFFAAGSPPDSFVNAMLNVV